MVTLFFYDNINGGWRKGTRTNPITPLEDIPEKYRNVLMLVMTANFLGNEDRTEDCETFSEALSTPELRVQAYNNLEEVHFTEKTVGGEE